MQRRAKVVVVGSSNTDMVVRTERIPAPGETVLGGAFVMTAGGKGANQAVAASRLGADVTFVARVGTDLFGDRAVAGIGAAGVNTRYIVRDLQEPSGVALIFVEESGQNSIVVAPGANGRLSPEDIEAARPAFESADIVLAQLEVPLAAVERAITIAKELGKTVILNPAPAQLLPDSLLRMVDILVPNEIEATMLLRSDTSEPLNAEDACRVLCDRGAGAVIITLGEVGVILLAALNLTRVPPLAVTSVDSTAAGDCFCGALAVALGEVMELTEAARFANVAAALSVTKPGAQTSMPARADVEAAIQPTTPS